MTPEEARELREEAKPGPWRVETSSLCECCTYVAAPAAAVCTPDAEDAPLIAAAPELAELVAGLRYEYAVQNTETGAFLREEDDGVVVNTSDPSAADWDTNFERAEAYAVWMTKYEPIEYRVVRRLAGDPEVVPDE